MKSIVQVHKISRDFDNIIRPKMALLNLKGWDISLDFHILEFFCCKTIKICFPNFVLERESKEIFLSACAC